MRTLICPSCGLERDYSEFIEGVCKSCYYKDKSKFEIRVKDILICKSCGRMKVENFWKPFSEDSLIDYFKDNIKSNYNFELIDLNLTFYRKKFKVLVKYSIDSIVSEDTVSFTPKYQYCVDCYKKISDFFDSLIQIRGFQNIKDINKKMIKCLDEAKKNELKKGNFTAFLQKMEDVNGGLDLYLGSKTLAQALLREIKDRYNVEIKTSYKIVGILQGGKNKVRTTFLVRLKE